MQGTLEKAVNVIVNPIIQVAFAVAVVIFVYGVFEFVRGADAPETRTQGQQHMLWGLVGLTIMVAVFTIMKILMNTLGINGSDIPEILRK
jgi:hypothetical protein